MKAGLIPNFVVFIPPGTEDKNTRIFHRLPIDSGFDFAHHGMLINAIQKGSTFESVLKVGDTIVEVDGHPINHDGKHRVGPAQVGKRIVRLCQNNAVLWYICRSSETCIFPSV